MYQYFEDAIETEERDIEHKVLFPSKSTFKGRRWDGWDQNDRQRTIDSADSRLVVSHNDADGLVSAALFKDALKDVSVVNIDYENIKSTLEYINQNGDEIDELYVSDLNLDEVYDVIHDITDTIDTVTWIDHHKWGDKQAAVSYMGVDVRVDQSRCAAGLVSDHLTEEHAYSLSRTAQYIVRATEDHDLWEHNMERIQLGSHKICVSKVLSQLAFYSDNEKFIDNILDYGRDFIDYESTLLRGDKTTGFIAEMETQHNMKVSYIVDNETTIKNIGSYKVAFVHGRASPGQILERLSETEDIDILIHTKPSYPVKASVRSTETFNECHKIAEMLGGGGHEQAAGCKPDLAQEPMHFFRYITNHGQQLQNMAEEALREHLSDYVQTTTIEQQ